MSLKNYLATLQALIAETPFVNSTSIFYEERPPTAGLVKGTLVFCRWVTARFQGIPYNSANTAGR